MLHRRKSGCAMWVSLRGIFSKAHCEPARRTFSLPPKRFGCGKKSQQKRQIPSCQSAQDIISTTLQLHAVHIPWHCSQWASSKCPATSRRSARAKYATLRAAFQPETAASSNNGRTDPQVERISLVFLWIVQVPDLKRRIRRLHLRGKNGIGSN